MTIWYEKVKLFNRFFYFIFIPLFLIYGILSAINIMNDFSYKQKYSMKRIQSVYTEYKNLPDKIDVMYKSLENQINMIIASEGINQLEDEVYTEYILYNKLYQDAQRKQIYLDEIKVVLDKANTNLLTYNIENISTDKYIYQYQKELLEVYSSARDNVKIGFEHLCGWNVFFNDINFSGYLYVLVVLFLIINFFNDKYTESNKIIQLTRYGRETAIISKIILHLMVIFFSIVLVEGIRLLIIFLYHGLSSPFNNIQAYISLYPYNLSILQYLFIYIGVKILTAFSIYLTFIAIFCIVKHVYMFFAFYISYYILNAIVYNSRNVNISCNTFFGVNTFLSQYRSIHIFFKVFPSIDFYLLSTVLICIIMIPLIIYLYIPINITWKKPKFLYMKLLKAKNNKNRKNYSTNCTLHELYKQLIADKKFFLFIVILILLVIFQCWNCNNANTYMDSLYKDYINSVNGIYTTEKAQYLKEERIRIQSLISQEAQAVKDFQLGKTTLPEYSEYLKNLYIAKTQSTILERLEDITCFFKITVEEYNKYGSYTYETGYLLFFNNSFDDIITLLIIIFACMSYCMEYKSTTSNSKMIYVLHTTANGDKYLYRAKLIALFYLNNAIIILYLITRFLLIWNILGFENFDANIFSLTGFRSAVQNISILQFIGINFLYIIVIYNSISAFLINITRMLKNTISPVVIGSLLLAPIFFRRIYDSSFLEYLDITKIINPHTLAGIIAGNPFPIITGIIIITLGLLSIINLKIIK